MAETAYTYSITADTANGECAPDKLTTTIADSAIVTTLERIDTADDSISLVFTDALSTGDNTLLDGIITAHSIPLPSLQVRCVEMSFAGSGGTALKSPSETYATLASFIFQGVDNVGDVYRIAIGAHVDEDVTGAIRVIDRDTGLVVGEEAGLTNTDLAIISMEPINNLPRSESILEIQVKGTGGKKKAATYLHCLTMYFD